MSHTAEEVEWAKKTAIEAIAQILNIDNEKSKLVIDLITANVAMNLSEIMRESMESK